MRGCLAANMPTNKNIANIFFGRWIVNRRVLLLFAILAGVAAPARASGLNLPPEAEQGIHLLFSGKTDEAILIFRNMQAARPEHPLGYVLEAEAIWWKLYCGSMERKYNTLDAWNHARGPGDDAYFALADKVIGLSEAGIARSDTAEMELYAGVGYMLRARLTGQRVQKLATAHAGVEGRKHLLRCLELDPGMADAYTGLGLYNYYVDTLSAMAKALRFFMGIPGGDKRVGLDQLETGMTKGELISVDARFYAARNLRNYDQDYARAGEAAAPLVAEFPDNPVFQLLAGDIAAKLGHTEEAASKYRAALAAPAEDPACAERLRRLVRESLTAIGK